MYYLGLFYNIYRHRRSVKKLSWLLAAVVLPPLLVWMASVPLHVALKPYIVGALEIISGYNETSYSQHRGLNCVTGMLVGVVGIGILAYRAAKAANGSRLKNGVIAVLFAVAIFVLYKQGFVRGPESDFFIYALLIFLVFPDFYDYSYEAPAGYMVVLCATASAVAVGLWYDMPISISNKLEKHYSEKYKSFSSESVLYWLRLGHMPLPQNILDQIGESTVDVYPWNVEMLVENGLNYNPAPVLSYLDQTPYLSELNFAHFNDPARAPEFFIYDYLSTDDRFPLFDEARLSVVLRYNYRICNTFDFDGRKLLLLQKKQDFKPVRFVKRQEYAMALDSKLVPQTNFLYVPKFYYNLAGKVAGIVNHSPEIRLQINVSGEGNKIYRTSNQLLQTGVFSTGFINDTRAFRLYMERKDDSLPAIRYFEFKPGSTLYFKDKVRMTEYQIVQ